MTVTFTSLISLPRTRREARPRLHWRSIHQAQLDAWSNCKLFIPLTVFNSLTSFAVSTQCSRSKYPSAGLAAMSRDTVEPRAATTPQVTEYSQPRPWRHLPDKSSKIDDDEWSLYLFFLFFSFYFFETQSCISGWSKAPYKAKDGPASLFRVPGL